MTPDLLEPPAVSLTRRELERRRVHLQDELRRGRTPKLVPLAAALAVLVALAVTLPGRIAPTRMTLVDQALAAMGSGPTIHVVLEMPKAAALLDLKTGRTRELSNRIEFWSDAKLGTIYVVKLGGGVTHRVVFPRRAWSEAAAQFRPFVTGYRRQLERGSFHVVGKGSIRGAPVTWIAAAPTVLRTGQRLVREIGISTATYKPLGLRDVLDGRPVAGSDVRVLVAETTSRNPAVFAQAENESGLGGWSPTPNTSTGIRTTLAEARAAMNPDPIVPTTRMAGLERAWIGLPDFLLPPADSYRDQVDGLSLYYGKLDGYGYPTYTGSFVSINEITSARAARLMVGAAYFRAGKAVITPGRLGGPTMAALRRRGLYIIISASSVANATAAVRALSR